MRKFFSLFPAIMIVSAALISCKVETVPVSKVPMNKLLRVYEARCTDHGTTYMSVKFLTEAKFDTMGNPFGKAVELDDQSTVTVNGQTMEFKKGWWSGVVYQTKSEKWPGTFTFTWTDSKGRRFIDTATMDRIELKNDWLRSMGGRDVAVWAGSPVRPGETINITVGDDKGNQHYSTNQVGARSVHLTALPPGTDMLGLTRTEITRTLVKWLGKELMDETEYGVFIKIYYSSEDY